MLQRLLRPSPMTVYPRDSLVGATFRSGQPASQHWPGHLATASTSRRWANGWQRASGTAASVTTSRTSPMAVAGLDEEDPGVRRKRTEAVLLFHRGPVNLRKLAVLAGLADATEARTRIREMNEIYDHTGSALRVEEVAGGHQLLTRPGLAPWLRRIKHVPPPVQLGDAAMETLAIIAYRQPVLRADVEAIRGVACGELIRQLMQRDLVRISGRSEDLGRPYLYGTTPYFLQIFGLKNVGSIPALPGASIADDSEDTLAIPADTSQAIDALSPIEPPMNVDLPAPSPFDVVTPKESDVSIAPGPVVFDEVADFSSSGSAIAVADHPWATQPDVVAVDDDDEDDFYDDEDEDDVDDEDDDWDDDEDDVEEDDDADSEWEEVGDDDEVEEDADVEETDDEEEDEDVDDEEEDDDLDDEDVWDDDEDDDDWDDDDEEEEEWD